MKYMTFTASTPFAALAILLEYKNIYIEDYKIIKEAQIPYLFVYDQKQDIFKCGSQLNNSFYLNLYLNKIGFSANETTLKRKNIFKYLSENEKCIISFKAFKGTTPCVYLKFENDKYTFINPHFKEDSLDDIVHYTEQELLFMLPKFVTITTITEEVNIDYDINELINDSISDVKKYQKEFYKFLSKILTSDDLAKNNDKFLRPISIDLLLMMEIIKNKELIDLLIIIKKEVLTLITNYEEQEGFEYVNKKTLDKFFIEYINLLSSVIRL